MAQDSKLPSLNSYKQGFHNSMDYVNQPNSTQLHISFLTHNILSLVH
jgi:hypothetical protein